MSIEVVDANAGQTVSAGPMTIRILEDGNHTNHRLGMVEVRGSIEDALERAKKALSA